METRPPRQRGEPRLVTMVQVSCSGLNLSTVSRRPSPSCPPDREIERDTEQLTLNTLDVLLGNQSEIAHQAIYIHFISGFT